jgi:hypothetical protein
MFVIGDNIAISFDSGSGSATEVLLCDYFEFVPGVLIDPIHLHPLFWL